MKGKTQPLVSCIMPTHNRRRFVPQALRYFLRQDYPNKELIIVDDGTDPVEDLVPDHPRIRYRRLDQQCVLGTKRNLACEDARGDLIAHWDDDDWMASRRLTYQIEQLLREQAEVCGLDRVFYFDPENGRAWQYVYPTGGKPWVAGGTLCYTKACWEAHPFGAINIGEDNQFVWASPARRLAVLPDDTFYVALIHPNNTSRKQTQSKRWQPRSVETIRRLIGEDRAFYEEGAPPSKQEQGPRLVAVNQSVDEAEGAITPRVIVSIPYFQCKPFIRKAVESILGQTYANLRVVVVNDGDKNPPWDALAGIDDPRLVRFELSENYGRYFADAVVINAAADPYFLVQDADDWSEPRRLEVLLRKLQAEKASAALSAGYQFTWCNGSPVRARRERYVHSNLSLDTRLRLRCSHHGLFKTEALRQIGGYYGGFRISYDMLIMNLLLMTGRVTYVNEPLYNRLVRPDSLMTAGETGMQSSQRRRVQEQLQAIYGKVYTRYRQGQSSDGEAGPLTTYIQELVGRHIPGAEQEALARETKRLRLRLRG